MYISLIIMSRPKVSWPGVEFKVEWNVERTPHATNCRIACSDPSPYMSVCKSRWLRSINKFACAFLIVVCLGVISYDSRSTWNALEIRYYYRRWLYEGEERDKSILNRRWIKLFRFLTE